MLVLNLPFKALMFLTLMRPSLVLFLVLWLKLVKDFLKVRCRLALLPFLAVQNQNEPQLRDENAHNDKSVHGVLNPTYQAGLRRDAVQPDIEAERKKRDEIEAGKSYCSRRFGGATCDDK